MKFSRITVNPYQMNGMPCIRGLRIPVATIVASGGGRDERCGNPGSLSGS